MKETMRALREMEIRWYEAAAECGGVWSHGKTAHNNFADMSKEEKVAFVEFWDAYVKNNQE